jgi:hypothetical protein
MPTFGTVGHVDIIVTEVAQLRMMGSHAPTSQTVHTGIKTVCWFFNYGHKWKAPQKSKEKSFHEVLKIRESCRTQLLDFKDRQSPTPAIVFTVSV